LPAFVTPQDQRRLVRWSLCDHARHPNETNLDTHYVLPADGIWNAHLQSRTAGTDSPLVRTRASESLPRSSPSGPRQLIANDPASADNFSSLQSLSKPPPEPSTTVSDCLPSHLVSKLRWANIGWSYHWGSKQYDFSRGKAKIDPFLRDLCKRAVGTVPWEKVFDGDDLDGWGDDDWSTWKDTYEPDAGIVNFYQTKDTLMAHVDRSEVCATSPLVSISLGNAAIFLIGDLTRDTEPIPILLRSGDVLIMSGPACRRAYHGVPRILETTLPEHFSQPPDSDDEIMDWEPYKDYMSNTRININVRQVFPKGFDPQDAK
jgi:alkylated DNA repair protein alkB family protein 1